MNRIYTATCKTIYNTLTANPMPHVVAALDSDGALKITYYDVIFILRENQWHGGVSMFCQLNSHSMSHPPSVHTEIARVAAVMAAADGKPNPQHLSDLFKIGNAMNYKGAMNVEDLTAFCVRLKRQSDAVREYNHKLLEIHHALGVSPTALQDDVIKLIATIREADPLAMLGAPVAYSSGERLTVKERLQYLLARISE